MSGDICNYTDSKTKIALGSAGLSEDDKRNGYLCTICSVTIDNNFQDLHITKTQAIELRNRLTAWLKDSENHEKFLEDMQNAPQVNYTDVWGD